jgi:hypothetical protein
MVFFLAIKDSTANVEKLVKLCVDLAKIITRTNVLNNAGF